MTTDPESEMDLLRRQAEAQERTATAAERLVVLMEAMMRAPELRPFAPPPAARY